MTVKKLLTELGNDDELQWWIAYDQLEPLSDEWLQTGILAATIANAHRTKGKSFKATDFMPVAKSKAQSPDEQKDILNALAGAINQKQIKGEKLK